MALLLCKMTELVSWNVETTSQWFSASYSILLPVVLHLWRLLSNSVLLVNWKVVFSLKHHIRWACDCLKPDCLKPDYLCTGNTQTGHHAWVANLLAMEFMNDVCFLQLASMRIWATELLSVRCTVKESRAQPRLNGDSNCAGTYPELWTNFP